MYKLILLLAFFAVQIAANLYSENNEHQHVMWKGFKSEYKRSYESNDDHVRFGHFLRNLRLADERNQENVKAGGDQVHGITKYMDWSQEEIETLFNARYHKKSSAESVEFPSVTSDKLVDWSGKYTTPVKNQGQCGSCWAFSATEQIESDTMRTKGKSYVLAPQQITSCDGTSFGCNGGWTESAYKYVQKAGGLAQEKDYPYTSGSNGVTGSCKENKDDFVVTVTGFRSVMYEASMGSYVSKTGPLSVCLDASTWSTYTGGIMKSCPKQVDHCVQAVGVQTGGSDPYWKVRNSWGTGWGESGYIRLSYGDNTCNIDNDATYTTVNLV